MPNEYSVFMRKSEPSEAPQPATVQSPTLDRMRAMFNLESGAAETPEDPGQVAPAFSMKNWARSRRNWQTPEPTPAPPMWDWNRISADAAARGMGLGEYVAGNWGNMPLQQLEAKYRGGPVQKYADGGAVTSVEPGLNEMAQTYGLAEQPPAPQPVEVAQAARPATPGVNPELAALLERYAPGDSGYGAELKTARSAAAREAEAFNAMMQKAIEQPGDTGPNKAEMYFRLASAFGAPTRTGGFMESVGKAGEVMGEYAKGQREAQAAERARRTQLGLKAQEMKMGAAKEDLTTLRQLAGEEMRDKRTIATELIKDYVKSGQPASTAGKQAQDEGLKPGTPEFQKRVAQISDLNVERQMAQVNSTLANMSVAQANLALQQGKFGFQQEQAKKLSPQEVKLKTETEDVVAQTDQALINLKKAYSLNPNTFDASLVDIAQRKALEATGSKDPKVQNTREMENLLEKAALSSLKSTFPGAISNDERKALQDVQGLGAKSKEERAKIMKNGYTALKAVSERARKRLNEINSGVYRNAGGIEEGAE